MWQEYAVEPSALSDFMHLKYVVEKFGYAQGRVLSEFPSGWLRQAYANTESMPDVRRKTATALLQRLKADGLLGFEREFRPVQSWSDNARREHEIRPFRALVTAHPEEGSGLISVEELTDDFLSITRAIRVIANAENLCAPMEFLLRFERELVLIDPYWRFGKEKCRAVLGRMLSVARQGKCRRFTFVTRNDAKSESQGHIRHLLNQHYSKALASGFSLRVYLLDDSQTEDKLHARYLLGKKTGLRYDKGFDEAPDERVEIGIMDRELHSGIRALFLDHQHASFATAIRVELPEAACGGFRFGG